MSRSIEALAREAIEIQSACNLSGLCHGWSRAVTDLRSIVEPLWGATFSTDRFNHHPINILWASKLAALTGCEDIRTFGEAYQECRSLAGLGEGELRS